MPGPSATVVWPTTRAIDDVHEEDHAEADATIDILDQLVDLFVEKNGREPNKEEINQWISVFKSLKIEDIEKCDESEAKEEHVIAIPTSVE